MTFPTLSCLTCPTLDTSRFEGRAISEPGDVYDWAFHARPNQKLPLGNWRVWLILAGRGFGKTRTGAETIREWVTRGEARRICLLGDTFQDVRRVMIEGESGLLSVFPPHCQPTYSPSKNQLLWPNGARAECYSAHSYNQLRGPQFDSAWVDELAKFKYAQEAWDQLMMGLRLGARPRVVVTTTPRSIPLIYHLRQCEEVHLTGGSTFENAAHLSLAYLKTMQERYANTPLGLQEIQGQVIDISIQALWTHALIAHAHWPLSQPLPPFERVVVAVDPAVTHHTESDETGLIVAAVTKDALGFVLADLSGRFSALEWGKKAVEAYHTYKADCLVAEVNNGGDLVQSLLSTIDASVHYKGVRATHGKRVRAEPIAALYAQKKIFHNQPFPLLEAQLMTFPHAATSPDRMDALIWALTELMLTPQKTVSNGLPRIWAL